MAGNVEEKFQDETASTAFQLVWGAVQGVGRFIAEKEAMQRGMLEYARKFLERYGQVNVLGMHKPIPLLDIYVAAQVISPRSLKSFRTVDDLQEMYVQRGRRNLFPGELEERRRDCLELANEIQFLNVLGEPGAGKSTFLRRLGLEALLPRQTLRDSARTSLGLKAGLSSGEYSQYAHNCLPVLIELRRFRTDDLDLSLLLQSELEICGLPDSKELITTLLKNGRLLILLDGIDEVPSAQLDAVINHIRDFIGRHGNNRFVISCRTAFYKSYFAHFTDVLLSSFSGEQIANFVRNWFRAPQDQQRGTAEAFLQLLVNPVNSSALELATTPLLLTFLCLTYDDRQRLPPNRSELYRQALEILLERWAASKRVHDEPVYRELHSRLEVQMLAEIAASSFRDNRYFLTHRELTDRITRFLRDELNAPKHLDSTRVLEAIEVHQGLLVQRAQDAWSFSHLTIQEYLTAVWYESNQKTEGLVRQALFDVRWREVFILVAGAATKADDLLRQMQRTAEKPLAEFPAIIQLLHWTSKVVVPVEDPQQVAARRVFALHCALSLARDLGIGLDRDRAYGGHFAADLAFACDNVSKLASDLNINKGFDLNFYPTNYPGFLRMASPSELNNFILHYVNQLLGLFSELKSSPLLLGEWGTAWEQVKDVLDEMIGDDDDDDVHIDALLHVQEIFAEALHLPLELRNINLRWEALGPYAYACQVIVNCKNAATRISRHAWEDICQRLLNPPGQVSHPSTNKSRRRPTRPR